jgi:hypothetical protein
MTFPSLPAQDSHVWYTHYTALDSAARGVASTVGEGSVLRIYGHSYTVSPGLMCTSGWEFFQRAKTRWNATSATTYGVSASRMTDTVQDILGQNVAVPVAGSTWAGTRKGVVILDGPFNDFVNHGASSTPTALTTGQVETYRCSLRTALAALRSNLVDTSGSTTTGSWTTFPYAGCVGGSDRRTLVQNSSISTTVTVPTGGGTVWVLDYTFATDVTTPDPHGTVRIDVDGAQAATVTSADFPMTMIYATRSGSAASLQTLPQVTKLTGLTPGSHVIKQTKTDATSLNVFSDAIFVEVANPVPVLLLIDPLPDPARWGLTTPQYNTTVANRALLIPVLQSVAAEFSNVVVVDPALNPTTDLGTDGIHPNDAGMRKIADALSLARASIPDSPGLYTTV